MVWQQHQFAIVEIPKYGATARPPGEMIRRAAMIQLFNWE
jgi:hypothetical protein